MKEPELLSIKGLIALTMADIEIFLTMESDQKKIKEKLYSRDEIVNQLESSGKKICKVLVELGYNIDNPLVPDHIVLN